MSDVTELEHENLGVHVEKCSMRYTQMNERLNRIDKILDGIAQKFDRIDGKINSIESDLKKGNKDIIIAVIAATATIIGSVLGIVLLNM